MTISSISGSTVSTTTTADEVKQLQAQIKVLTKKIETENKSKDDAKTKAKVIAMIQQQIALLQAQIQQISAAKSKQNAAVKSVKSVGADAENKMKKNKNLDVTV